MTTVIKNLNNFLYKNKLIYKNLYNSNNALINRFKSLYHKKRKNNRDKTNLKRVRTMIKKRVEYFKSLKTLRPLIRFKTFKSIFNYVDTKNEKIRIYNLYKTKRVVYNQQDRKRIYQNSIGDLPQNKTYDELIKNKNFRWVNQNFDDIILPRAFQAVNGINDILDADIQILYAMEQFKVNVNNAIVPTNVAIRYSEDTYHFYGDNIDPSNLEYKLKVEQTDIRIILLGYRIIFFTRNDNQDLLNNNDIRLLKAYKPSCNRKYHEMTTASTNLDNLCIYMTYLDITGRYNLKYMRRSTETKREIEKMLKKEGKEIYKAVKNGELVNSLELLTKKYNEEVLIIFYGSMLNKETLQQEPPIYISKGKICRMTSKKYLKGVFEIFENKKVFLYEKNIHVAPMLLTKPKEALKERIEKKLEEKYRLKAVKLKGKVEKVKHVLGFDFETFKDINNIAVPFCICVYGNIIKDGEEKFVKKSFYGLNCVKKFIFFLNVIKTDVNKVKTRPNKKIPQIYIYGFNNSRFDNFFFYRELYKLEPHTKYCFAGNSIKYIKFNNISILDISLHYKIGSLRDTAKYFNLEEQKGVYPYKFDTVDNLYYEGKTPELKYWNSEGEYNEYVKENGNDFNKKKYSIKYCMLDSKIVYDLGKLHLDNCVGEINGRKYNVQKSPTSANLSIKMFQQVFLNDTLFQSDDNIIEYERSAYHGGRTEVFKREFMAITEDNDLSELHYVDINSAHPSGMTLLMPYKFQKVEKYNKEFKLGSHRITNYHLYHARSEYKGDNKRYISNLIYNYKDNLVSSKSTPYGWFWGMELRENIKNGCDVYIDKVCTYEGKDIFKEFANYFYNERLKIKKINPAKSLFYKSVINSLYGKFGQKFFNKSCLVKNDSELFKILSGDLKKLQKMQIIEDGKDDIMMIEYKELDDEYTSIGKLVRFSSYISATTRCKLSEIMRDVGHENVYYCDTDSIFTSVKPNENFIHESILGKWKYECKPIKRAVFLAPKVYYYETLDKNDKIKIEKKSKGVRSSDLKISDYEDLNSGKIEKVKSNPRTMFFRSFNNIKLEDKTRSLKCVLNKRKFIGNDSEAFENLNEYIKYNKC